MLRVSMHLHALLMQVSHPNICSYFLAFIKLLMEDINSTFFLCLLILLAIRNSV